MINIISNRKKYIFLFLVLISTIAVCVYFFLIKNIKRDYKFYKKTNDYEYKVDVKITKNEEIDNYIKKYVQDKISFVKKRKKYKLDFNTNIKKYKDIVTYDYSDFEYESDKKVYEKHMVYNFKNGKLLKIEDIVNNTTYLKERINYYVLHYLYQNNKSTDKLNINDLNNFYLDTTGVIFYIPINGLTIEKKIDYFDMDIKDEFKIIIGEQPEKKRIIRNIENYKEKKVIAITFDDGPSGDTTKRLLDELDKREIKVTFFVVGNNVSKYPEIIKRIYIDGHDIGIHTKSHSNLTKLSDDDIYIEKSSVVELINGLIGYSPTMLRPPYGSIDNRVKSIYPMKNILWNVDSNDWKTKDVNMIYDEIMKSTDDGDIVLLHDLYETSVDGALKSIDELLKQGYEFVTVSELLQIKGDTKDTYYGF